jgi:hypothetical protein
MTSVPPAGAPGEPQIVAVMDELRGAGVSGDLVIHDGNRREIAEACVRAAAPSGAAPPKNLADLAQGDGLYYVAQEAAFAPGISGGPDAWPAVITSPKVKNGRLVKRVLTDEDRAALRGAAPAGDELREAATYLMSQITDWCGRCELGDAVEDDEEQGWIHPWGDKRDENGWRGWECLAGFLRQAAAVLLARQRKRT